MKWMEELQKQFRSKVIEVVSAFIKSHNNDQENYPIWYQKNNKQISTLANELVDIEFDIVVMKRNFVPDLDIDIMQCFNNNADLTRIIKEEFENYYYNVS